MEKLNQNQAMELLFKASNSVAVKKPRINPVHVQELVKKPDAWKDARVVTTPDGMVVEGIDYVAAIVKSGQEHALEISRDGIPRRARKKSGHHPTLEQVQPQTVAMLQQSVRAANLNGMDRQRFWDRVAELVADKIITTKEGNS